MTISEPFIFGFFLWVAGASLVFAIFAYWRFRTTANRWEKLHRANLHMDAQLEHASFWMAHYRDESERLHRKLTAVCSQIRRMKGRTDRRIQQF